MIDYKGYIGTVQFDAENRIFAGMVRNTPSVITYSADNVDELEEEFKVSVDEYIAWCKEDGLEPEKLSPDSISFFY